MPLQVLCYERADDIASGVSGVVTRARGIRATLPQSEGRRIPMAAEVKQERVLYLLDPIGASRRSGGCASPMRCCAVVEPCWASRTHAFELPWTPGFLRQARRPGALDRPIQSVGRRSQLMASGLVQIWPGTPVQRAAFRRSSVVGACALPTRAWTSKARPPTAFMPGMDVRARLTVVGDGPVGAVGQAIDETPRHARRPRAPRLGHGHEVRHRAAARRVQSR